MNRTTRTSALTVLAAAAAGAVAALIIRGQMSRFQRDLFSPKAYRRLAALGHMNREPASVDAIRLLRDFIAWEPRKRLRERAQDIADRMMAEAARVEIQPSPDSA